MFTIRGWLANCKDHSLLWLVVWRRNVKSVQIGQDWIENEKTWIDVCFWLKLKGNGNHTVSGKKKKKKKSRRLCLQRFLPRKYVGQYLGILLPALWRSPTCFRSFCYFNLRVVRFMFVCVFVLICGSIFAHRFGRACQPISERWAGKTRPLPPLFY